MDIRATKKGKGRAADQTSSWWNKPHYSRLSTMVACKGDAAAILFRPHLSLSDQRPTFMLVFKC